ncbi:AAA family ATPase [Desulfovibrio ferrophilus]|uniref:non-specific protein-tyrosine kinase n=1 Tax=Desulfovibrio ferrophilus TaxID=241368 RepID=A0A2Z6B1B8_9BACT|nr:AAA family ATPase [Desulfovibrio ferrophilus]BBD09271.1 capsular exopolysaccharide family [Desulfovibrio ferrophilus]
MSKISKALERARQQREQVMESAGAVLSATPPAVQPRAKASSPSSSHRVPYDHEVSTPSREGSGRSCLLAPPFGKIISDGKEAYGFFSPAMAPLLKERQELLKKNRIMTFLDQSYIDHYNYLRTQVLQRTLAENWNTLMVTSVNPGEGKTTTAINLALSMSRDALQTALIVDANLRKPSVAQKLGLAENALGLSDYLFNDLDVQDLIINPRLGNMIRVLLAGKPLVESADILSLPKIRNLIQELKHRYPDRYVIFDCPHLKHMPDSLVFSSYVDGIILVVEAGKTTREDLMETLNHLKHGNIVGLVFNRHAEK